MFDVCLCPLWPLYVHWLAPEWATGKAFLSALELRWCYSPTPWETIAVTPYLVFTKNTSATTDYHFRRWQLCGSCQNTCKWRFSSHVRRCACLWECVYLVQPLLPAVLSFDHELDTVRERGEDAGGGRLERDGFTLEVNTIDPFRAGGRKHCHRQDRYTYEGKKKKRKRKKKSERASESERKESKEIMNKQEN